MEKRDATWKNIEEVLNNIEGEIESAEAFANDAQNAANCASDQMGKLKKFLKIRKEYEGQSVSIEDYLKNMEASVGNLNHNLEQIRKETEDYSKYNKLS